MKLSEIEWNLNGLAGSNVLHDNMKTAVKEALYLVSVLRSKTDNKESSIAIAELQTLFDAME